MFTDREEDIADNMGTSSLKWVRGVVVG